MIYKIYCWFRESADKRLGRKIQKLRKKELTLRKRYRAEMNALIEKVILHNRIWGPMTFQFWYDFFWDRGARRCSRLMARIERLEDRIQRLEGLRCNRRLTFLPYSSCP